MPARRKAVAAVALGLAAPSLAALSSAPAAAHGSMGDPVSRVAQCYAEGPQSPKSDACRAAVAAGGAQALYDWNGIRIGDANGRHQELIPDGRLCSAGNEEFRGLDLARADWPATAVHSGPHTFGYRVTAPHKGTFRVYLTRAGYDPARPLAWSDLDLAHPVATAVDPVATGGFSSFSGTLPGRSGRHVLYAVWQRSDSPEAFYSCSDVVFPGGGAGTATGSGSGAAGAGRGTGSGPGTGDGAAPAASAPSEEQIQDGAGRSTVEHHGHGDDDAATTTDPTAPGTPSAAGDARGGAGASANAPRAAGVRAAPGERLARTGGDGGASYLAVGGAAVLALGAALLFASVRRRAASAGRHGR
ncbi:lytic polysaccharide monooxygenase [Streptomyces sp. FL07-04A]|uniref:lytic polysaccharide monooxygenase auxiliary activity family 9 protein n=1 Tax=Streptomyces sp. FL07-04A TaxID=3028658 RepID=UPI0029A99C6D|nr:lytic polysaccharide monooxygenase [Streptomyces sp. FL07-04A]MDX3578284.1 lytic polysaccharide monooxygenase [Streptomyces sp. FL07-04A]